MWHSKKFIIVTVLAVVLLSGSIVGVAIAADNSDVSRPKAQHDAMLVKVCEIYQQNTGTTLDHEALKEAFVQAASEMRPAIPRDQGEKSPENMQDWLQSLVTNGKITQEQADQYISWWQSRPDVPVGFGPRGHGGFPGRSGQCAPTPSE